MTSVEVYRSAFRQRMEAAAIRLGVPDAEALPLAELADAVVAFAGGTSREAWLVFVAVTGMFPHADELRRLRRAVAAAGGSPLHHVAIDVASGLVGVAGAAARQMEVVHDVPVVDVGHSATSDHNTGIQRVVRRTLPQWSGRPHRPVVWFPDDRGFRDLGSTERDRLLRWGAPPADRGAGGDGEVLIVPWGTPVILPEVAAPTRVDALACLAEASGTVGLIGYDAIPLVSADLVDAAEAERFARYLSIVKHAATVAAISESAAEEYRGFASMLPAQGLRGPAVVAVPLADESGRGTAAAATGGPPLILCVGSHEPRKNQHRVLDAAVSLHEEGASFELVFVGGGSLRQVTVFDRRLRALRRSGMRVVSHRRLPDDALFELYGRARFSVFVSLHEGYGLPVVESLSSGVPVLTSDYGSVAEIARGGGCVMVDPRSTSLIADGMRRLLVDDVLIARLRAEIARRPTRSWGEYADDLWNALVGVLA